MNKLLKSAFEKEVSLASHYIAHGELDAGFAHLERAHVLGQKFVVLHARSHWLFLKLELARRRPRAVSGQIVRIFLGIVGSALGVVPMGNTGGSGISMFKRMPIASELQNIIDGIPSQSKNER